MRSLQHEIGAQAEISCRAEVGPLSAILRLERGGTDLVIVPTMPTSKARLPGPGSARGKTDLWMRDIHRSLHSLRSVGMTRRGRAYRDWQPTSLGRDDRKVGGRPPQARSRRGPTGRRELAFGEPEARGCVAAVVDRGGRTKPTISCVWWSRAEQPWLRSQTAAGEADSPRKRAPARAPPDFAKRIFFTRCRPTLRASQS